VTLLSWTFFLQEVKQTELLNEQQLTEMMQRHVAEKRRLPKVLKNETKTRTQQFKKSLRLTITTMTPEQELEKIQEVSTFL
jgi:Polo kinase kinase